MQPDRSAPSKDARIGILGGGPGGLTAAFFLQQQGYENLTVLERESEVGGKALTVDLENSDGIVKNYELGAEFITYSYKTIWHLCDLLKEQTEEAGSIMVIKKVGSPGPRFKNPLSVAPLRKLIPAALKYLWIGFRHEKLIETPSNVGIAANPVMSMRTSEFIAKHSLESLRGLFLIKGFGYGNLTDFPVIDLYRTVQPKLMLRIIGSQIPIVKHLFRRPIAGMAMDGTQGLFKLLAAYLDQHQERPVVHVDQEVSRIRRGKDGEPVTVTVKDGREHTFDVLIVAIPPGLLLKLMDKEELSPLEFELYSKYRYHPYYVDTFKTLHHEKEPLGKYYYQNLYVDRFPDGKPKPEPIQLTKRWEETDIVARGYNWELADNFPEGHTEEIDKVFHSFMDERMGVPKVELIGTDKSKKYWPTYHPHVPIEDFQDGFFDKFETLQGQRSFYYTGSALAFESMEQTASFSQLLVDTYFAK